MSCIQVNARPLVVNLRRAPNVNYSPSMLCVTRVHVKHFTKTSRKLASSISTYRRQGPLCLFGDKGKSQNTSEGSPWKSLEKALGSFKKNQSIEEVLKQQMTNKEFYEGGGSSGGNRSGGGGGGGSGGGGFGSDESDEEGFAGIIDEIVQVTLAVLAFVLVYIYIIDGEDITALLKDIVKAVFGGKKSFRVQRVLDDWGRFVENMSKSVEDEEYALEDAIFTTPTWHDSPNKYKRVFTSYMSRLPRDNDDDNDGQTYREKVTYQKKDSDDYSYQKSDEDDDYTYQKNDDDDDDDY